MSSTERSRLKSEISQVDADIVALAARRSELAKRLGDERRSDGLPARDYKHEKDVVSRAIQVASESGLTGGLAERLMLELIRASLVDQERGQVAAASAGTGRSALVIGGLGRMGGWFVRFLKSQGFSVTIADPRGDIVDWRDADGPFDLYVLAAPLGPVREILEQMAAKPPTGLIFDIGSLKTPLRKGLQGVVEKGGHIASVHPMFGPDTDLLSGRHIVIVDVGDAEAALKTKEVFESTMASLVEMELEDHDRLVAYILGLSHALNIAFFTALAESGELATRLADLSSTTFDRQLAVASQVAGENPHLYFEIQALNEFGSEPLVALSDAVAKLRSVISDGDIEGFAEMMTSGSVYLRETMGR